jgi:hypothetical protein
MKTFLLPRISSRQQTKLEEAGVEFHHWENNSILITGKRAVNKALKALGAEIVKEEEDFAHFVRLVLDFEEEEPEEAFVVRAPPRQFGGLTRTPVAPVVPVPEQPVQPEPQVVTSQVAAPQVVTQPVAVDMERRARSRRNYIQACRERLEQIRAAAKERATPMKAKVEEAEAAFFNATRAQFLATSNISAEELAAKLTQEQEAVRNLDKVEMVRPTSDGILVFTKKLVATAPDTGEEYRIGKFLIWLTIMGESAGVSWFNASRRVDAAQESMNAPYVFADGDSAAHEVKQTLLDLLGQFEVAAAADLAIQFVENVDGESPFNQHLTEWPRKKGVADED